MLPAGPVPEYYGTSLNSLYVLIWDDVELGLSNRSIVKTCLLCLPTKLLAYDYSHNL